MKWNGPTLKNQATTTQQNVVGNLNSLITIKQIEFVI